MEKEFVSYYQAVALKELGFDELSFRGYDKNAMLFYSNQENGHELNYSIGMNVSAPLKQQVFRWFREKYNLPNHIDTYWQHDWNDYSYQWSITENHEAWTSMEHYKTYEEAENACIDKLIELAKQQEK